MKKYRVRGMASPDCVRTVTQEIKNASGTEEVHINLATGEITYGPAVCIDENILREAVEKSGYQLEEEE